MDAVFGGVISVTYGPIKGRIPFWNRPLKLPNHQSRLKFIPASHLSDISV